MSQKDVFFRGLQLIKDGLGGVPHIAHPAWCFLINTKLFIILCLSSKTSDSDDMAAGKYIYWYKKSTSMIASQESFTRAAQVSSTQAPR